MPSGRVALTKPAPRSASAIASSVPYAPQSNGKVERFFRTIDDECLYVRRLFTFAARSRAVADFVHYYNHQRPHLSLGGQTPVQRRVLYFQQAQM